MLLRSEFHPFVRLLIPSSRPTRTARITGQEEGVIGVNYRETMYAQGVGLHPVICAAGISDESIATRATAVSCSSIVRKSGNIFEQNMFLENRESRIRDRVFKG